MRTKLPTWLMLVTLAAGVAGLLTGSAAAAKTMEGGTFRVELCSTDISVCFDHLDPALAQGFGSGAVLQMTCATLMRYPDKVPPAGYRLVPELAARTPKIADGGRTYTFTIRRGLRFSNGAVVTGQDIAHSLNRILDPRAQSRLADAFGNIAGADD